MVCRQGPVGPRHRGGATAAQHWPGEYPRPWHAHACAHPPVLHTCAGMRQSLCVLAHCRLWASGVVHALLHEHACGRSTTPLRATRNPAIPNGAYFPTFRVADPRGQPASRAVPPAPRGQPAGGAHTAGAGETHRGCVRTPADTHHCFVCGCHRCVCIRFPACQPLLRSQPLQMPLPS